MTDNFFKIAPFKIYSSSVDTGYATEISSSFKSGLDITNMHTDRYADMNDAPIQSPFTYRFVGGSQHRHVPLNDGTDTPTTRPELFNLSMSAGTLKVVGPDFYDSSRPRAYYFRDTFAKRPVNVANFKIATGSSEIGNYLNDYEILQTVGRTTNNKAFIEATGSGFAQYVTTHYVTGAKDPNRALPDFTGSLSSGKYIFVNRFNAPGGTEVSSRGVLDTYAEEYAPNNAMPWRNRSVRSLLRSDLARYTPKAGIGVPTTYHNDNRNPKPSFVDAENYTYEFEQENDVFYPFLSQPDPSYIQYGTRMAFCKASGGTFYAVVAPRGTNARDSGLELFHLNSKGGVISRDNIPSPGSATTGFAKSLDIISASSGLYVLVGDPDYGSLTANYQEGSAWLFHTSSNGLVEDFLTASDAPVTRNLPSTPFLISARLVGSSVSLASNSSGIQCFAGSPRSFTNTQNLSSVYNFTSNSAGITQQKITASDNLGTSTAYTEAYSDGFGLSVSVATASNGDLYLSVGAPYTGSNVGKCYVYHSTSAGIAESQITSSTPTEYFSYGASIAYDAARDGIYLLSAAPRDDDAGEHAGACYLYFSSSTSFTEEKILPDGTDAGVAVEDRVFGLPISRPLLVDESREVVFAVGSGGSLRILDQEARQYRDHYDAEFYLFASSSTGGITKLRNNSYADVSISASIRQDFSYQIGSSSISALASGKEVYLLADQRYYKSGSYHFYTYERIADAKINSYDHDSGFVNHEVPRSDLKYRWISASATTTLGQMPGHQQKSSVPFGSFDDISYSLASDDGRGDYVGISGSATDKSGIITQTTVGPNATNLLSRTSDTSFSVYDGPYQHPSWRQIRGSQNPVVRQLVKESILSLANRPKTIKNALNRQVSSKRSDGITNFREPVVSEDARPSVHTLLVRPSLDSQLQLTSSVKYTLSNDIATFTNQKIRDMLGIKRNLDSSFYKKLKDTYLEPEVVNTSANPVDGFLDMSYSRVLYPSPINAFLNTTRERTEYSEIAGTGSDGYDRVFGTQRTFYKDSLTRTSGSKNSQGASAALPSTESDITLSSSNIGIYYDSTSQFTQDENYANASVFVFGTDTTGSPVSERFFSDASQTMLSGSKTTFQIMRGPATLNGSVSLGAPTSSVYFSSTKGPLGTGNEIGLYGNDTSGRGMGSTFGGIDILSGATGIEIFANADNGASYFVSSSLGIVTEECVTGSWLKGSADEELLPGFIDFVSSSEGVYFISSQPSRNSDTGIASIAHSTSAGISQEIVSTKDSVGVGSKFGRGVAITSGSGGLYYLIFQPDYNDAPPSKLHLYRKSGTTTTQTVFNITSSVDSSYSDYPCKIVSGSDGLYFALGQWNADQVYLYHSNSSGTTRHVFTSSSPSIFGDAIDLASGSDGIYLLVGDYNSSLGVSSGGAAHLFYSSSGGITEQVLTSSDLQADDHFGGSVSVASGTDGIYCLVGAEYEDDVASQAGAAYLFHSTSAGITEQKLTASDGASGDAFGASSILSDSSGIYCAVGAGGADIGTSTGDGAVYLFHSTSVGITEHKITASIAVKFHSQSFDASSSLPPAQYRDAFIYNNEPGKIYFSSTGFSTIESQNLSISNLKTSGSRISSGESLSFNSMATDKTYSFFGKGTYRSLNGELMTDDTSTMFSLSPLPSLSYLENYYNNISGSQLFTGFTERLTEQISGKNSWYDTYGKYAVDVRPHNKNKSIIPEFKMSEHIPYYVVEKADLSFRSENKKFLSLDGASITSSANDEDDCTFNSNFVNRYARTTDSGRLVEIAEEHSDGQVGEISKVEFSCNALKKLLPYNGFYPKERTVQLGNLLSQSIAPFVSASYSGSGDYPQQALMSILKPLMSPGILYNTIKSGIAVEYPIYTGSVPGSSQQGVFSDISLSSAPNYRLPFETLVDLKGSFPEGSQNPFRLVSSFPLEKGSPSVSDVFSFSTTWDGNKLPLFELGMHNFLAESVNFFLEGDSQGDEGKLTSFRSKPQPSGGWEFNSGKTYYMDVILRDALEMNKFVNYSGSTGAGADEQDYKQNGKLFGIGISGTLDPAYVAYTPPMFYGESVARIKFSPPTTATYTLSEIFEQAEVTETLNLNQDRVATVSGSKLSLNSIQEQVRMPLSASVNMFGTFLEPEVSFDPETGAPTLISETSNLNPSWVISTRYECPVLEMSSSRYNELYTAYAPDSTVETALGFDSSTIKRTNPRTMWTSYGQPPTGSKKITLELANSFPDYKENPAHASLIDTCGFTAGDKAIGKVRGTKKVSEAIVMIPYLDEPIAGVTTEIEGKNFIAIDSPDTTRYSDQRNNLERFGYAVQAEQNKGEKIEHTSITRMIKGMQMFNMPPNMDFYKHSDITPFVMYFFPFSTDLTRTELADIWQGVMPQSAMRTENDMVDVSHDVNNFEFFGNLKDRTLISKMRFMVFKVKQVAKQNYYEITEDATDDSRYQFKFSADGQAAAVPHPSYNWPYDYFSLVEDATIEAKYTIKNNSEE